MYSFRSPKSSGAHISTKGLAEKFFLARVVMATGHIIGFPGIRSIAFFASLAGLIMILLQVV